MAKFKQLHDLYRFQGFVPQATIRGVFGEPRTVVLTLQRRRKKRCAVAAGWCIAPTTTNEPGGLGIYLAATSTSISFTRCAEFIVGGAGA